MMVAASRCFKDIRLCKAKINAYAAIPHSFGFNSSSVCRFGGRVGARRSRGYSYTGCLKSIPVGVPRISPFFTIMGGNLQNYKPFAVQASSEEVMDGVLNQIRAIIEKSSRSSGEICAACIEKLCREGKLSTAVRLLQSLRDNEIHVDSNAYKPLLAVASNCNDIDIVSRVFKDLLLCCKSLPSTSYFHFAKAFAKTENSVQLLKFVKEISELTFPRSLMAVNRIIYAFGESNQSDKALLIYHHMNEVKCKPDLITFNNILDILGRARRIDEMIHEFASMKDAGIVPDFISYNTVINNLRKVGRLDLCLVYFREMVESGIAPDLLTYTALMDVWGRLGNTEESLKLFSEMKVRRIRPSIYIYRLLISNLKKIGKVELATTLMEEMNDSLSDLAGPGDFKRKGNRKGG